MKIVTVIPLKKGSFKENLTYFTAKKVPDGSIVNIPLRNKKVLGLVVSSEDALSAKSDIKGMSFNLKKIEEIKDQSIFRKEYLKSILEISDYFASRKNTAITSLIPTAFREEYDKITKFKNATLKNKSVENNLLNLKTEKLLFQAPLEERISFYKTFIRESFAKKQSVFMVLPTEHDIETFSEFFSKGIEKFTFTIHGNLTAKKQIEKYKAIITSSHPVLVLGTTPFLSIPRQDFGTIIIENENSTSYKMFNRPYFDLRTFVEVYATKIKSKLILADSILRFETIARKDIDNFSELHNLSFKTNFRGKIETLGQGEKFKVLTDANLKEIKNNLEKKQNTFIFSLRKGLATMTICRDCSEPVMCDRCSAPVVLYLSRDGKKRMFTCNRCATEKNPLMKCPKCDSWNLMPLGIGTDTVSEEIKKHLPAGQAGFPKTKIFKLDKESAKTAIGAKKIVKEFEESSGSILIGTEMALFYLKEKLPLSVVASFDSLWSIPNFRMGEKIIQLMLSILSKTKDKLIIQTKNESDPAILAIRTGNLLSFIREELEDRETLGYPLFKRFIKITFLGNKEETIKAKEVLIRLFQEYQPEIFSGFVGKLKNKYVTNALIRLEPKNWSLPEISAHSSIDENLLAKLQSLPPSFIVNIDPEDLL